jgi:hypothetical protein
VPTTEYVTLPVKRSSPSKAPLFGLRTLRARADSLGTMLKPSIDESTDQLSHLQAGFLRFGLKPLDLIGC